MPYIKDLTYCKETKFLLLDDVCTDLIDSELEYNDATNYLIDFSVSECIFSSAVFPYDSVVVEFSPNDNITESILQLVPNVMQSKSLYFVNISCIHPYLYGDINCKKKSVIIKKKNSFQNISLISKFNCFKKSNCNRKTIVNKRKGAGLLSCSERSLLMKSDSIMLKNSQSLKKKFHNGQVPMINSTQRNKMALPIKKESENLLFVASKISTKFLIGPPMGTDRYKKCCVIDLDETLVHSSFKELSYYDFKVDVNIEGVKYDIYIVKRPHVDLFLNKVGKLFECVLFTASLSKYANLVVDLLDSDSIFRWRLFREACVFYRGGFVKDLSMLGRPIDQIVILDNSPLSFLFNTKNAVHMISWFDDPSDRALLDIIPYCERLANYPSVIKFLQNEQPPISVALPIRSSLTYPQQMSSSLRQSGSDHVPLKANLNPITSVDRVTSDAATMKKVSATLSQNYSDRFNVQAIPAIRSLFGKNIVQRPSDSTDKMSYLSVLNGTKQRRPSSDFFKSPLSKSSVSTSSSASKEPLLRKTSRNSAQGTAFNTSLNQRLNS